jgi:general stress protein YciG
MRYDTSHDSSPTEGVSPDVARNQGGASIGREEGSTQTPKEKEEKRPKPRGFAAMDRTRVSEIAQKGGRAAHRAGTAHRFTPDEAREAGRKGGQAPHVRRGPERKHEAAGKAGEEAGKTEGDEAGGEQPSRGEG